MVLMKGWRYVAFVSGVVGFIGLATYPIILQPIINPDRYKKVREQTRPIIKE